jgi:hypothetical protein
VWSLLDRCVNLRELPPPSPAFEGRAAQLGYLRSTKYLHASGIRFSVDVCVDHARGGKTVPASERCTDGPDGEARPAQVHLITACGMEIRAAGLDRPSPGSAGVIAFLQDGTRGAPSRMLDECASVQHLATSGLRSVGRRFELVDLGRDELGVGNRSVPFSAIFQGAEPRIHVGPPTGVAARECDAAAPVKTLKLGELGGEKSSAPEQPRTGRRRRETQNSGLFSWGTDWWRSHNRIS